MTSPSPHASPVRPRRRRPSWIAVTGVLCLLAALGCLGWVGYQYFGTNLVAERAFRQQTAELRQQWRQAPTPAPQPGKRPAPPAPPPSARLGEPIALLRIPAFGPDYEVPILSGTDLDVLARGVGHYSATALPGQVGNFAIAGHRVTHGEPFARLLELDKGDQVIVETSTATFTYVLDEPPRNLTVRPTDTWVLDPVPGQRDRPPTRALITLTTCQDLFRSPDRSVGFGHLERVTNKR